MAKRSLVGFVKRFVRPKSRKVESTPLMEDTLTAYLPPELTEKVVTFLNAHSLLMFSTTCKVYNVFASSDVIWRQLIQNSFEIDTSSVQSTVESWKSYYKRLRKCNGMYEGYCTYNAPYLHYHMGALICCDDVTEQWSGNFFWAYFTISNGISPCKAKSCVEQRRLETEEQERYIVEHRLCEGTGINIPTYYVLKSFGEGSIIMGTYWVSLYAPQYLYLVHTDVTHSPELFLQYLHGVEFNQSLVFKGTAVIAVVEDTTGPKNSYVDSKLEVTSLILDKSGSVDHCDYIDYHLSNITASYSVGTTEIQLKGYFVERNYKVLQEHKVGEYATLKPTNKRHFLVFENYLFWIRGRKLFGFKEKAECCFLELDM